VFCMDILTMKLVERNTILPIDLVVFINSYLYEKLTDLNFREAIALWFDNEDDCKWKFGHISNWNTSKVTNMSHAFRSREFFIEDLSRWDVSKVINMEGMFFTASQFNGDLSSWNVRKATNMSLMFAEGTFNGDLSSWDVGNVTDMNAMFASATQFNGDLSSWDVGNVTDMSWMFNGASQFNGDLSRWNVSKVKNMERMFQGTSKLKGSLNRWDVGNVCDMNYMFYMSPNFYLVECIRDNSLSFRLFSFLKSAPTDAIQVTLSHHFPSRLASLLRNGQLMAVRIIEKG
jgi:surface protein